MDKDKQYYGIVKLSNALKSVRNHSPWPKEIIADTLNSVRKGNIN